MPSVFRAGKIAELLQAHWLSMGVGFLMLAGVSLAVRWITTNHQKPQPQKVMQLRVVELQKNEPPNPTVPPRQTLPPRLTEEPENQARTRVSIKVTDISPPDAPPPSLTNEPAAGPLALAAAGEGPGDAFNLVGNPGGKALLSGGYLGDGKGSGIGQGYDPNARYGWYYAQVASKIEKMLRKEKKLKTASTRVELRIWTNGRGEISRVQIMRSTGDKDLDRAIRSVVGLKLSEPLPEDIPMPFILRLTARRPG